MKRFLGFLFLLSFSIFCQEKQTLKEVLNQLSQNNNITFSYNENQVQQFSAITVFKHKNLETILLNLAEQTQLVFEKIDDKNYIVRRKKAHKINVCGRVLDAKTKKGLSFIALFFNGKSTITNEQGYFEIENILEDEIISIKELEYKKMTIPVAYFSNDCLKIFLEENIQQLSEIVITDYLARGLDQKKDGSIVLNPKKIGILPGVIEPDVLQTLQLIPGVHSPDETASGIHVRGSTPDQNLVLFDGMKMYHFSHFFGLISAFNPYITNDVKLYRSGTHAKYGNNVGGVLDINTQNNIPDSFSFGLGSTLTHSDFYVKTPMFKDKVGLIFSARRSITDVFNTITYKKFAKVAFQNSRISEALEDEKLRLENIDNDFFYEDYHSKIIVKPNSKNKLTFSYLYNLNNLKFSGEIPGAEESFEDKINIENKGFHWSWKYGSLQKGTSQIAFSSTNFNKEYDGFREFSSVDGTLENTYFIKNNYIKENDVEYVFEKQTKNNNKWQLGSQYNNYNVYYLFGRDVAQDTNQINDIISDKTYNYAFFTEYEFNIKNKWLVNLGMRWQYFNNLDKSFFEPRLNVNYKKNKAISFKFSSELKHQSIAQVVDFRSDGLGGLFDRFWALSDNQSIPVLNSFQTSFGSSYQKNGWTLDAELYYKFTDGILYLMDENIRVSKYFNGSNTVKGIDLLIKKQWKDYSSWISYTLSDSSYLFDNLNEGEKFKGSYDAPHNLIWSHNYTMNKLEFSMGWRFHSGIPYTLKTAVLDKKNNLRIDFEELNSKRLPDYHRIDFSMFYMFKFNSKSKVKGKIGLTLQNLVNRKNILNRDYDIETIIEEEGPNRVERQVLIQKDRISLGFVPNLIFRVAF
ncbi:TonB-dependent receptor domain-containing protein [Wenyingzhuangia sp. 2_MG-2023]|uniref:TonB-dependent receptor n=1 Tax=Wenyingzhuangia sp. 2_MG-2023 TaxID=3062639 RepID=UPI0026E4172F|nr:TonB-dependent receptor [Wenyingzhuangia sp. 2_MG-2023]MDO6736693.1 TonB-dependent receptor [Wenyingzhuangia sp. 2_MG-2023]